MIIPRAYRGSHPRRVIGAALGLSLALGMTMTFAQPAQAFEAADALQQRDKELEAIRDEQKQAGEAEVKLRHTIDSLGADRRQLNAQLIATAARVRTVEAGIAAAEDRLKPLADSERSVRRSLESRRAVITEVLAVLQRMGRRPPPALLVRPDDALQAVRSAMMLSAVVPEVRQEAAELAGDLADLAHVRQAIAEEQERLQRDHKALAEEQQRLTLLTAERQKQLAETESVLAETRKKAHTLAREADSLMDLIAKLEKGLEAPARAARLAARTRPDEAAPGSGSGVDTGRLAPSMTFASARGLLPLPVNGVKTREFGDPDGRGGSEKGLLLATRRRAQVTSPCDGWVVYAGPFRSYGQLLILNAGDGYHVLLAGMERISVDIGQFVLTGEPVAVMGGGSQVAAILETGVSQPVLYVEFRKDGTPINPSPWWATSEGEKVRG